jgi:AraC family cel operon transcriptional repressor
MEQQIELCSITFIRPEDIHCFIDPIDRDFQVLNLSIDKDVMEESFNYLDKESVYNKFLKPTITPNVVLPKLEYSILKSEFEKMFYLLKFDITRIRLVLRILIIKLLGYFFLSPSSEKDEHLPSWIQYVLREMHRPEHFTRGVEVLYNLACRCQEHVCREFRRHLNKTPTEVVNEIRMENAALRLVYSKEKVIDICGQVGFENLSHFNHWFKKIYHTSPHEFRYQSVGMDRTIPDKFP